MVSSVGDEGKRVYLISNLKFSISTGSDMSPVVSPKSPWMALCRKIV